MKKSVSLISLEKAWIGIICISTYFSAAVSLRFQQEGNWLLQAGKTVWSELHFEKTSFEMIKPEVGIIPTASQFTQLCLAFDKSLVYHWLWDI